MIPERHHRVEQKRQAAKIRTEYRLDGGPGSGPHAGYKKKGGTAHVKGGESAAPSSSPQSTAGSKPAKSPVKSTNVKNGGTAHVKGGEDVGSSPAPASYAKISTKTLSSKRAEYQSKVKNATQGSPEHKKAQIKLDRIEGELAHRGHGGAETAAATHAAAPMAEHEHLASRAREKQAAAKAAVASGDYKAAIEHTKEAADYFKKSTAAINKNPMYSPNDAVPSKTKQLHDEVNRAENDAKNKAAQAGTAALAKKNALPKATHNIGSGVGTGIVAGSVAATGPMKSVMEKKLSNLQERHAVLLQNGKFAEAADVETQIKYTAGKVASEKSGAPKAAASVIAAAAAITGGSAAGAQVKSSGKITSTDDFAARAHEIANSIAPNQHNTPGHSPGAESGPIIDSYGGTKVFFHAIRQKMGLSKQEFKDWAIAANREGKIGLERMDLVGALNTPTARKILDEEINAGGLARFHSIERTNGK